MDLKDRHQPLQLPAKSQQSSNLEKCTVVNVDVISLDHDMSHHVSVDGNARPFACIENFSAVCYFIGEKYKGLAPPNLILHTSTPVGAQRMRHILDSDGLKSEYQPGKPVNR